MTDLSTIDVAIERRDAGQTSTTSDSLAVEEPLEIRLQYEKGGSAMRTTISVTMRTPGNDADLAAGFLFTEGVVRRHDDIVDLRPCGPVLANGGRNVIRVELAAGTPVDTAHLDRHSYTSSSCGLCGKTSLDALESATPWPLPMDGVAVDDAVLHTLPDSLRAAQALFASTGGLHASALFDPAGRLVALREDVGRHNALDKLIGSLLLAGQLPLHDRVLLLSGRVSYELVQKALMAGIPIVAAIGAPSSLAVERARQGGLTLVGFLRERRFNVYSHPSRIRSTWGDWT